LTYYCDLIKFPSIKARFYQALYKDLKMKYISKIIDVWQKRGLLALLRAIIINIKIRSLPYFDYWFDLRHGVNTCAMMFHGADSDIVHDANGEIFHYEAAPVNAVRSILKELPIDHSKYTFIDYGSGKARVLLLASEYPFKKIIGVELSKFLTGIADENLKICKNFNQKCTNIELCCANATQFRLPNGPLVIFFFTPFMGSIMEQVASNIQQTLNITSQPTHIVYYGTRDEIIEIFSHMNCTHQIVYSKRPFSASRNYEAHLFSFMTISKQNESS
jgi:hypothetical protein